MKHKQKLLTIILFGLSLCLLTGCFAKMFKSGDDMLDEAAIATLKALENGDAGVFIQEEEEKEDKEWKPNLNLRVKP